MKNLALLLLAFLISTGTVQSAKIKIAKKLFCVTEDGSSELIKGRKTLNEEAAETLISKTQSKIDKLESKAQAKPSNKLVNKINKLETQITLINECLNPVTDDNFTIGSVPSDSKQAFKKTFAKHIEVFGIGIFATAEVPDSKVLHAANIMAEYLDNDENGQVDNQEVVDKLVEKKAAMTLHANDESNSIFKFFSNLGINDEDEFTEEELEQIVVVQDLFGSEIFPDSIVYDDINTEPFDGSIEEILHLITHAGYDDVYPEIFAEEAGSTLATAMVAAKEAGHYNPLINEPDMPFADQNTEYLYWALTSILGAQNFAGRLDSIGGEWLLNTNDLVQSQDSTIYNLVTDPQYKLPTRLPDGKYQPQ